MLKPVTFGVELEISVGCLLPDQENPFPREKRECTFSGSLQDADRVLNMDSMVRYGSLDHRNKASFICAQRRIRETLHESGYPVRLEYHDAEDEGDVSKWEVVDDLSIEGPPMPKHSPFNWFPIEVRSPAYYFNQGALNEIEDVCSLLTRVYCLNINSSCGLHIHVGNSNEGFSFSTLRSLVAFLYAFEPQLNCLHPQDRIDATYCVSTREHSRYVENYISTYDRRPSPFAAVAHFLGCQDSETLFHHVSAQGKLTKLMAYNFTGMRDRLQEGIGKPTIEFRQHEGTLDGERIINWIKTVVGIIDFVQDAQPDSLIDLLEVSKHEKRERYGTNAAWTRDFNRDMDRIQGPVLSESAFDIIDLLQHIGLPGPARFYSRRLHFNERPSTDYEPLREPWVLWDYEIQRDLSEKEITRLHRQRQIWEMFHELHTNPFATCSTQLDDKFLWPAHFLIGGEGDSETSEHGQPKGSRPLSGASHFNSQFTHQSAIPAPLNLARQSAAKDTANEARQDDFSQQSAKPEPLNLARKSAVDETKVDDEFSHESAVPGPLKLDQEQAEGSKPSLNRTRRSERSAVPEPLSPSRKQTDWADLDQQPEGYTDAQVSSFLQPHYASSNTSSNSVPLSLLIEQDECPERRQRGSRRPDTPITAEERKLEAEIQRLQELEHWDLTHRNEDFKWRQNLKVYEGWIPRGPLDPFEPGRASRTRNVATDLVDPFEKDRGDASKQSCSEEKVEGNSPENEFF